jgi:hypothetical protein
LHGYKHVHHVLAMNQSALILSNRSQHEGFLLSTWNPEVQEFL